MEEVSSLRHLPESGLLRTRARRDANGQWQVLHAMGRLRFCCLTNPSIEHTGASCEPEQKNVAEGSPPPLRAIEENGPSPKQQTEHRTPEQDDAAGDEPWPM